MLSSGDQQWLQFALFVFSLLFVRISEFYMRREIIVSPRDDI